MNKKTSIGIMVAILILHATASYAYCGNGYYQPLAAWSDVTTFSKQQMSRLDMKDPSFENKLNSIRSITSRGYFSNWKKRINDSL